MSAEIKTRYSDKELAEFKKLIDEKIEKAQRRFRVFLKALT